MPWEEGNPTALVGMFQFGHGYAYIGEGSMLQFSLFYLVIKWYGVASRILKFLKKNCKAQKIYRIYV